MPRITPVHWRKLECVFQKAGFVFARQKGSHRAYKKAGIKRPLIIPEYTAVDEDIILGLIKTAELSREAYFKLLDEC